MEIRWEILAIILGACAVTALPRVLPLVLLRRARLPDWAWRGLYYVPVSVMAALIGQEVLAPDGTLQPLRHNLELIAAAPAFVVALLTRSLLATVLAGVLAMMGARIMW